MKTQPVSMLEQMLLESQVKLYNMKSACNHVSNNSLAVGSADYLRILLCLAIIVETDFKTTPGLKLASILRLCS